MAARGLDIPDVSHIFNYDVPIHPEDYIHRIGRTGRAGREGFAAMLVTPKDVKALKAIEKMLKQEIPWIDGAPAPGEMTESSEGRSNDRHRRGGRAKRVRGGQTSGHGTPAKPVPRQEASRASAADGNGGDAKMGDERQHAHERQSEPRHNNERHNAQRRNQHKPHQYGDRKPTHGAQAAAASADRPAPANKAAQLQPAPSKQQGMGDHVPAFMMRPVRIT